MEFAPFCAPFVGKNMLIFANICKNTSCKSVEKTLINQGKTWKIANDKSTIRLPRQVSCTINRTLVNRGKVGHNMAESLANTTVSTTKAYGG
jgi:hypothetical protein